MYTDKLMKSGVLLISATEHIFGDGAAGKLTLNMLTVFAQYYSDELSQKVTRGMDYTDEHKPMADICRHFNEQGIKTSSGADFDAPNH